MSGNCVLPVPYQTHFHRCCSVCVVNVGIILGLHYVNERLFKKK